MTANGQNAAPIMNISRGRIRTDQPSNPHEPECTATDIYAQDCICQRLHTAYQRGRGTINNDAIIDGLGDVRQALNAAYQQGRDDLADQIRTAIAPFYDSPHGKYLAPLMSKIRSVLINAGGQ